MTHRVVIATMWHGPRFMGAVDEAAPPSPAGLDAIAVSLTAENCGVKPVVRVLCQTKIPAYFDSGEPVCEDTAG